MNNLIIRCDNVKKKFSDGKTGVEALKGISLEIMRGETVAVTGPSGAGKSTLLHILGFMDKPTSGTVSVEGLSDARDEKALSAFRNKSIGFAFQFYNLLPEFTAMENIMMPMMISGETKIKSKEKAADLISEVGLSERAEHLSSELSGGEQQRIAIARALINSPEILLMDEPTGNLDKTTGDKIMDLLLHLKTKHDFTLILATHNEEVANRCSRKIKLVDGRVS